MNIILWISVNLGYIKNSTIFNIIEDFISIQPDPQLVISVILGCWIII